MKNLKELGYESLGKNDDMFAQNIEHDDGLNATLLYYMEEEKRVGISVLAYDKNKSYISDKSCNISLSFDEIEAIYNQMKKFK